MNEYRNRIKTQNVMYLIGAATLIAIQILAYTNVLRPLNTQWADNWNSFIAGVAFGVTLLLVMGFVRNLNGLRSEESLKKLFIKENDERARQVSANGKSAGASLSLGILFIAGIISGYFNIAASVTCIACLLTVSICMGAGKLYYSRKL